MSAEARAEDLAAMERLWCHYLTLAQELLKFIRREDIEEFLALAAQRGKVVSDMQALPEGTLPAFRQTPTCEALLAQIKPLDMQLLSLAKAWLNKSRRQTAQVQAYNFTAESLNPLGNIVNRKY